MRKRLARFGRHGERVALWIEGDRIVAQWRQRGIRKKKSWPNTAEHRKEAKAWAEELVRARGTKATVAPLTIQDLWTQYAEAEFHTLRERSQVLYREAWALWAAFVGQDTIAEDLGPATMAKFRATLAPRYAITSIARTIDNVKIVYAWGYRHRVLTRNDVRDYKLKVAKEQRPVSPPEYTPAEFEAILAQLTAWRPKAAWAICGLQGAREHQVLHLRAADVDIESLTVTWRPEWDKNGKEREQPIRPRALPYFRDLLERNPTGWLFPSRRGNRSKDPTYAKQSFWWSITAAERRAGVQHHDGRAAHGTRRMVFHDVLAAGGDLADAMATIGDTDLRVASRYLKTRNDKLATLYSKMDANGTEKAPDGNREAVSD